MVLEKRVLKRVGYDRVKDLNVQQRRSALRRAYAKFKNLLSLFRKFDVISTMNKKDLKLSKIFRGCYLRKLMVYSEHPPGSGIKTNKK